MARQMIRQFRYFAAVVEHQHVGKAAERLGIAQSALSQQIKVLETHMGVQLFHRVGRSLKLTEAGAVFYKEVRLILQHTERAMEHTRAVGRGETGAITVAAIGSAMLDVAVNAGLERFYRRAPQTFVNLRNLSLANAIKAVLDMEADAAIVRSPLPPIAGGLIAVPITVNRIVAAIPENHPLARDKHVHIEDLQRDSFVSFPDPDGIGLGHTLNDVCRAAGFAPNISAVASDVTSAVALVAAGAGVSLVPDSARTFTIRNVLYKSLYREVSSEMILLSRRDEKSRLVNELARAFQDRS